LHWTRKAKQRHKLLTILNDLSLLSAVKIPEYKPIYRDVRNLRLQKLANLSLPAADARKSSVRSITEIQA
jgi:hypothetical protein